MILVLSLSAKAFSMVAFSQDLLASKFLVNTYLSSLYLLQCQQIQWFKNHSHLRCFHTPLMKGQIFLFINGIHSRRTWKRKSNREFSDTCLNSNHAEFHNLSGYTQKTDKNRDIKKHHGRRDSVPGLKGRKIRIKCHLVVSREAATIE